MRWVAGNGAMEVAILLLVNTSKVLPVSAETLRWAGIVLAKQAQEFQVQWLCHPHRQPSWPSFLAQVEAQLERWSDLLGPLLFNALAL